MNQDKYPNVLKFNLSFWYGYAPQSFEELKIHILQNKKVTSQFEVKHIKLKNHYTYNADALEFVLKDAKSRPMPQITASPQKSPTKKNVANQYVGLMKAIAKTLHGDRSKSYTSLSLSSDHMFIKFENQRPSPPSGIFAYESDKKGTYNVVTAEMPWDTSFEKFGQSRPFETSSKDIVLVGDDKKGKLWTDKLPVLQAVFQRLLLQIHPNLTKKTDIPFTINIPEASASLAATLRKNIAAQKLTFKVTINDNKKGVSEELGKIFLFNRMCKIYKGQLVRYNNELIPIDRARKLDAELQKQEKKTTKGGRKN